MLKALLSTQMPSWLLISLKWEVYILFSLFCYIASSTSLISMPWYFIAFCFIWYILDIFVAIFIRYAWACAEKGKFVHHQGFQIQVAKMYLKELFRVRLQVLHFYVMWHFMLLLSPIYCSSKEKKIKMLMPF